MRIQIKLVSFNAKHLLSSTARWPSSGCCCALREFNTRKALRSSEHSATQHNTTQLMANFEG